MIYFLTSLKMSSLELYIKLLMFIDKEVEIRMNSGQIKDVTYAAYGIKISNKDAEVIQEALGISVPSSRAIKIRKMTSKQRAGYNACKEAATEDAPKTKNDKLYQNAKEPIFYGLPHTKQYPMPDAAHVKSAIRFFNYVSKEDEEELARNINKMIRKYKLTVNVGDANRFKKYYKSSEESVMTSYHPIVPYSSAIQKPNE